MKWKEKKADFQCLSSFGSGSLFILKATFLNFVVFFLMFYPLRIDMSCAVADYICILTLLVRIQWAPQATYEPGRLLRQLHANQTSNAILYQAGLKIPCNCAAGLGLVKYQ